MGGRDGDTLWQELDSTGLYFSTSRRHIIYLGLFISTFPPQHSSQLYIHSTRTDTTDPRASLACVGFGKESILGPR